MSFRIQINAEAVAEMEDICAYVAESSAQASERTLHMLEKAFESLVDFPRRFSLAPEASTHHREIRQMHVGTIVFSSSLSMKP